MGSKRTEEKAQKYYTEEFRAGAVALVIGEHQRVAEVARNLGVSRSSVDKWVQQARRVNGKGGTVTPEESQEFARLRKEIRELRMERDILKKATAFFAKEMLP
jgi:transposase